MNEENLSDQKTLEKQFLQIKSIRTSSNAFLMKLKEGDIIIALDGTEVNKSYEDLSKELKEIKDRKVLTSYRDGVFFNTLVFSSLGVICEQVNSENIPELNSFKLNEFYKSDEFYHQYELFKKPDAIAILLNTSPSILASLAPPLWMIQNRLWTLFSITMLFYIFLFIISPWLFFIGWILKSWYVGSSQIDILRLFYRLGNYRLNSIFCAKNEKEAQELSRKFDNKIDFYYSYLEPVVLEE
jgi:hypothetical protein